MGRLINLVGRRFGLLTVRAIHPERVRHGKARKAVSVLWLCVCDCGAERVVYGSNLRQGFTVSCGCRNREKTIERSTKHGHARRGKVTRAYSRWLTMRQRCSNPNDKNYRHYGARGIGICEEWDSFVNHFADVGDPPGPGLSLDRINNDGNYEPDNVRWATASEQARNQRPRKRKKRRSNLAEIQAYAESLARAGART